MIGPLWRRSFASRAARSLLIIAGLAMVTAGLAPADVNENLHVVGGAVPLTILGNSGLILAGLAAGREQAGKMRVLGPAIGVIGLIATGLLFSRRYLGLGMGGMECFAVSNLPIWTFLMGCNVLVKSKGAVQFGRTWRLFYDVTEQEGEHYGRDETVRV